MQRIIIAVIVSAISCLIIGAMVLLNMPRPTHVYLLPDNYIGWVEVIYDQPGYPALAREYDNIVYEIPPSGSIKTSSKNLSGTMKLYYVKADGQRIELPDNVPMIHGLRTSSGSTTSADGTVKEIPENVRFFVGTEEQWQQQSTR